MRSSPSKPSQDTAQPRPALGPREAFAITIGIVVGAGIFRTPALVAGASSSEAMMLIAWLVGGLLSIVGALCYAELPATYPGAGGDYSYLRRAYGPRLSFLYAWARLTVIQTGSVVVMVFVIGNYLTQLSGGGSQMSALFAAAAVVVLTLVNWLGVREGTRLQNWLTVLEVAGLVLIVVAAFAWGPKNDPAPVALSNEGSFGRVLVAGAGIRAAHLRRLERGGVCHCRSPRCATLDAAHPGAEPHRHHGALPAGGRRLPEGAWTGGVAGSEAVAADAMQQVFGPTGAVVMSALVVAAALTSANATLITGARSVYAAGRDFPALAFAGGWDERSGSPRAAMLLQGALALLLVGLGAFARDGFQTAVEYTAPVFWRFFLLVGIALFVLRQRNPMRTALFAYRSTR